MALDRYMPLPQMKDALAGSRFEDAIDCLQTTFDRAQIFTVEDLDNSPRMLTCSVCMVSTHKLVQHIRAYMEQQQVNPQAVREAQSLVASAADEEE